MGIAKEYIERYINKCNPNIMPGVDVRVYDSALYINDILTPAHTLLKKAKVIKRYAEKVMIYGEWHYYPDLVDVEFQHRPGVSRAHFTHLVEFIR